MVCFPRFFVVVNAWIRVDKSMANVDRGMGLCVCG